MENELTQLKREIEELKEWKKSLEASHSIPLNIDQAFRARFLGNVVESTDVLAVASGGTGASTLTGMLKGNGTTAFTATVPLSASAKVYYVSDSSGGAVNRKLTFTNGILTSET